MSRSECLAFERYLVKRRIDKTRLSQECHRLGWVQCAIWNDLDNMSEWAVFVNLLEQKIVEFFFFFGEEKISFGIFHFEKRQLINDSNYIQNGGIEKGCCVHN